jgi:hypothetical protein
VTIRDDDPRIQLFAGGGGLFPDVEAWDRRPGPRRGQAFAAAVTDDQATHPG